MGTGTTGSRVLNGTYAGHRALEATLAEFYGTKGAIVFSTGYQANLGMLSTLAGPKDYILIDADCHASIYDGCKMGGATIVRFRHNDPADLDKRLGRIDPNAGRLIVVEGLYSMLGDKAPLAEFIAVKKKHNATILVDEAHSMGIFGATGRGVTQEAGVEADTDFIVGTFSKSVGTIGGFCVSNHPKFDVLRLVCRPYVFTASLPPSVVASAINAIKKIQNTPALRETLWRNSHQLHEGLEKLGFDLGAPASPVCAVKIPDQEMAVVFWGKLLQSGVYVNLAFPPATPQGMYLLRCSLSAAHTPAQITTILEKFEEFGREFGIIGADAQQSSEGGVSDLQGHASRGVAVAAG
jgi:7-keto-8-aminopelargonate synthetase-like enzyme